MSLLAQWLEHSVYNRGVAGSSLTIGMQQVFGPKVKVSLPKSYHSADASKSKYLVFKGVSDNNSVKEFKELLDFNKINHAKAERMTSKRSGKNLTFIKIKNDNPKQAKALLSTTYGC